MDIRGRWRFLTVVVWFASCSWEVAPSLTAVPLSQDADACRAGAGTPGQPDCGVQFTAKTWGECNDCNDLGCSQPNDGTHTCTCYSKEKACIAGPNDAGVSVEMPAHCEYRDTQCACDDSLGPIYQCQCEGGGDDCHCMPPQDGQFDPTVECQP